MLLTDKPAFAALIAKTGRFYGKTPTGEEVADWFDLLEGFTLTALARAFGNHLIDPQAGQYLPKPADIIRHLPGHPADHGHPGPEEAWGLLVRLVNDEGETGVLTEEMREAWQVCDPILKAGDEVGARMCFLETYRKALKRAIETRKPPRWSPAVGSDVERRKTALQTAVAAGRISADHARSLLPAPVTRLEEVAGLLAHASPQADPDQPSLSERFRTLAAQLRARQADDAHRAMQAEQAHREAMDAKKAQIIRHWDEQRKTA